MDQYFKVLDHEKVLAVHDIRNKLSPITHVIAMYEIGEYKLLEKALPIAKLSINHLAQREVYK